MVKVILFTAAKYLRDLHINCCYLSIYFIIIPAVLHCKEKPISRVNNKNNRTTLFIAAPLCSYNTIL